MKSQDAHSESLQTEDSSSGFYELFGMNASYGEIQAAVKRIQTLMDGIQPHYHEGAITSLTISCASNEHAEELESLLHQMKVYPWLEDAQTGELVFSIDNNREIERLLFFFSLDPAQHVPTEEIEQGEVQEERKEIDADPYSFPLPTIPQPDPYTRSSYVRQSMNNTSVPPGEVVEVDDWMKHASDNFSQGVPFEGEEEPPVAYNKKGIDLRLFKQRYHYYKDAIEAPDGELLSWEEHKEILLEAKNDPDKMKQAVDMSVGLVKMVVDRVLRKFNTNEIFDEDDLFQAGMEGLLHGLSRIEAREDVKPASYLVPCIEGQVRKVVRTQKSIFTQGPSMADKITKYRRAQAELERTIPHFTSLTREQQEEKIKEKLGFTWVENESVLQMLHAKKELFEEDAIDPEYYEQEDPGKGIEAEQLKKQLAESLPELTVREELVLRLYFGILGESHFVDKDIIEKIRKESKVAGESASQHGSIEKLYHFDLAKSEFDTYNPAEQIFLALIGKIPESWVQDLIHGGMSFEDKSKASLVDIADVLGVSPERARQIMSKGLRHLRHPARSRKLRRHLTAE